MGYAKGTDVAPEKSRAEIEKLLTKQKVSQVGVNMDLANGRAIVLFTMPGVVITPAQVVLLFDHRGPLPPHVGNLKQYAAIQKQLRQGRGN